MNRLTHFLNLLVALLYRYFRLCHNRLSLWRHTGLFFGLQGLLNRRREHEAEPLGQLLCARPVLGLDVEIADHRRVVLKNGYPTMDAGRDKGTDGEYRHGDGVIARVLAWAATRAEGEPAAGETVEAEADTYRADRMNGRRSTTMFRKAA